MGFHQLNHIHTFISYTVIEVSDVKEALQKEKGYIQHKIEKKNLTLNQLNSQTRVTVEQ